MIGLERRFQQEMLDIYARAKRECNSNATRFLQMVRSSGGLAAAHALLGGTTVSDGFVHLWQLGRVDLSVEALILKEPWRELFSPVELGWAVQRLSDVGSVSQHRAAVVKREEEP